jgi:hypothetical protein
MTDLLTGGESYFNVNDINVIKISKRHEPFRSG